MEKINKKFIKYINLLLKKQKITQDELSKKVGCTYVSMSRYLNGQRQIPVNILFEIKKELNISDDVFMTFFSDYSIKWYSDNLKEKIESLTEDNKIKIIDYIDYLLYSQNREKKKIYKKED